MPNYKYINGERTVLTDAEEAAFKADSDRLAADRAANDYKRDRVTGIGTTVSGYGSIGEQLDQLYHDMKDGKLGVAATTGSWFVGISSVKTAIAKT